MEPQVAHPHSAEELAALSTLVHNVLGWLLLAVAAGVLYEAARRPIEGRLRLAWPALAALLGLGLTGWVLQHMSLYHQVSPFADPAQVQHELIGTFAGVGAAIELVRRARRSSSPVLEAAWPTALVGVGVAFLVHEQGTAEALLVHWALAATFVLSGLAVLAVVLCGDEGRSLRAFGAMLLAGAAVQLVRYDEKPGAHGAHQPEHGVVKPASEPTSQSTRGGHGDAGDLVGPTAPSEHHEH